MDAKVALVALAALAQASRLTVFQTLVGLGRDGANPGELAQQLGIPANTLSFHLKTLAHADLVTAEQAGRFIRYRANFERMQDLVDFLTRNCCGGDIGQCIPAKACGSAGTTSTG